MGKRTLNAAIVGCGKIADAHVEEIAKLPQARVVACCDLEILMAEQLAVRYGIPRHYADFEEMLAGGEIDVVHITTPPQSHRKLALEAMRAGCHVYVEKPLALNRAEAEQIVSEAERLGRKLTIGYEYNFDPPARAVRTMLQEGILGDPVHVESFYGYELAGAYGSAFLDNPGHWLHRLPGKLFHNIIDHVVNKIVPFLPPGKPEVLATGYRRRAPTGAQAADAVLDELRFVITAGSRSGYGTFSAHARPLAHFLRVYGTKNTVHADFITRTVVLEHAPRFPSALGRLLPPFSHAASYFRAAGRNVIQFLRSEYHFFAGLNFLISAFYDSIRNDAPPPVPYSEMLMTSGIMDDIFAQVRQEAAAR